MFCASQASVLEIGLGFGARHAVRRSWSCSMAFSVRSSIQRLIDERFRLFQLIVFKMV